jgi:hypothetical protein
VQYGTLKQRLDSLGEMVATIQRSLGDEPPLESKPWARKAQVACLKQRIVLLEQQSQAAASQDEVEPHLSKGEWMRVQRALTRLQIYHGKVDGDPGRTHATASRTRVAIREWQRSIGETPTGRLTQTQMQMLTGGVQTAG